MIVSLLVGLATWAAVATWFLVFSIRRSERRRHFHLMATRQMAKLPSEKRFEALIQMHEVQEKALPWFQRSLSTLGVVAFFSMSAAALTQTISAQFSEFKASAAERRYSYIQDSARMTEVANSRSSRAMLEMLSTNSPRLPEMVAFLQSRLELLADPRRPKNTEAEDAKEGIAIAIALQNIHCAAQIWRNHPEIGLDTLELRQAYKLSFAQFFYFLGEDSRAGDVLDEVEATGNQSFAEDVAALRYLLSGRDRSSLDRSMSRLSSEFGSDPEEIERSLIRRQRVLDASKNRLRLKQNADSCRATVSAE